MYARLLAKAKGRRTGTADAKVFTLPAPIGGLNARDALSAMKPEDAIIIDNIIPDNGKCRLRSGYEEHANGIPSNYVETVMEYAPPNGLVQLFAAGQTEIYDVTSAGAVGAAVVTGQTNGRWQSTMMATTGGNFLAIVNGVNNYQTYNGSAWTDQNAAILGITGGSADTKEFSNIALHASRLWFVQRNTLDAWYLPTGAITGTVVKFPLGPLCKLGGSLLAIGTWTKDGGDGMDDLWVAITTKGEVIVYQGTDPASADTWQKVGVFRIAEPIGKRCMIKVGGDLGIITSTGIALLSQLIGTNLSGQRRISITNKISGAFIDMYKTAGGNFGWQIQEFASQALVLINVPAVERTTSYQFVINIETGGWCRFTGINALCWGTKNSELYFGAADGKVYKFGDALSDNGAAIPWIVQMSFNRLKGNNNKVFRMARALLNTITGYIPAVGLLFNYDTAPPTPGLPLATGSGPPWNTTAWNTAAWGSTTEEAATWQSVEGEGRSVSIVLSGASNGAPMEFNEVDLMYEDASWI